jgi:CO/xanthine dehydrogenase Mo-binding subunit
VQGAIAQGIGYALSEELVTSKGKLQTRNLSTYIIPSSLDLPDIASHAVETIEHTGPFGMKGIGEVGMNGPLPAIGSAMFATGIAMTRAPFTPERVLVAMNRTQETESC